MTSAKHASMDGMVTWRLTTTGRKSLLWLISYGLPVNAFNCFEKKNTEIQKHHRQQKMPSVFYKKYKHSRVSFTQN